MTMFIYLAKWYLLVEPNAKKCGPHGKNELHMAYWS